MGLFYLKISNMIFIHKRGKGYKKEKLYKHVNICYKYTNELSSDILFCICHFSLSKKITFSDSIYTLTMSASIAIATYIAFYLVILWNYAIWSVKNSGYKLKTVFWNLKNTLKKEGKGGEIKQSALYFKWSSSLKALLNSEMRKYTASQVFNYVSVFERIEHIWLTTIKLISSFL